jgi:hypothetical protein
LFLKEVVSIIDSTPEREFCIEANYTVVCENGSISAGIAAISVTQVPLMTYGYVVEPEERFAAEFRHKDAPLLFGSHHLPRSRRRQLTSQSGDFASLIQPPPGGGLPGNFIESHAVDRISSLSSTVRSGDIRGETCFPCD